MEGRIHHVPLNPGELDSFLDFLRDCPGRIVAAVVPGMAGGKVLVERIKELSDQLDVTVAEENITPSEVAQQIIEHGSPKLLTIICLDGREKLNGDAEIRSYWEAMNFQRERLVSDKSRTCFLLNQRHDEAMIRHADDLREWVRFFRFPEAIPLAEGVPFDRYTGPTPDDSDIQAVSEDTLRDQLKRAKAVGYSRDQIARDFAVPLFRKLVSVEKCDEALQVWSDDLYNGLALELFEPSEKIPAIKSLCIVAQRLWNFELWEKAISELQRSSDESEEPEHRAVYLEYYGDYCYWTDQFAEASKALSEAISLYARIGNRQGEADCLQRRGAVSTRDRRSSGGLG